MPKFHVIDTFEVPSRKLFVLAGSIVEGEIRKGMYIHVPCNSGLNISGEIHCIEFARRKDGEYLCLCLEAGQGELDFWRALNINGETVEISEEADG
jgi:hypothetical protein